MSTITPPAKAAEVRYPDQDGNPMSDNTLQFKWIVVIKENLEILFRDRPDVFVAGDLLWYPVEGDPKTRTAPDAMVAFDRPKGYRGSYKQWEEGGVAPQVVFEITSPGNRPRDAVRKFQFYDQFGVEEYYIYDPDDGALTGWLRTPSGFQEIDPIEGFTSPRLGVRFEPGEGPDCLKIHGPDGQPFLTPVELAAERDAERERAEREHRRADTERDRAEEERRRADAEHERAERLAARLRELGHEPD